MFSLSGVRCHGCGMALENPHYRRDENDEGLYWADPKINPLTDVRLDFCGVLHYHEWYVAALDKDPPEAGMVVT